MSDRRSSVESSSTVGKAAKSSAFLVDRPTSSTMMDNAMLKVNSMSRANGGSGNTNIARMRTMNSGAASVRALELLNRLERLRVPFMR